MGQGDEYQTPPELMRRVKHAFPYLIDFAASHVNHQFSHYFTKDDDALVQPWADLLATVDAETPSWGWLNPPYSHGNIDKHMHKCMIECYLGAHITALVRDDPSTQWYLKYVNGVASHVLRLNPRVKFVGADGVYNFPSCLVVYTGMDYMNADGKLLTDGNCTKYAIWRWKEQAIHEALGYPSFYADS